MHATVKQHTQGLALVSFKGSGLMFRPHRCCAPPPTNTKTPAPRVYLPSSPPSRVRAFGTAFPRAQPGDRGRTSAEWERAETHEISAIGSYPWFRFGSRWRTVPVDMTRWRHLIERSSAPGASSLRGLCAGSDVIQYANDALGWLLLRRDLCRVFRRQ